MLGFEIWPVPDEIRALYKYVFGLHQQTRMLLDWSYRIFTIILSVPSFSGELTLNERTCGSWENREKPRFE
jgi:hypothetical protein